jgi:hypothetical protein
MFFKNNSVKTRTDWDRLLPLPNNCLEELRWRLTNLSQWNGRSLLPTNHEHTIYIDASDKGWGGVYRQKSV